MNAQNNINRKINEKGNMAYMYGQKNVQYDYVMQNYSLVAYDSNILLVKGNKSSLLFAVVRKVNRHKPALSHKSPKYNFAQYKGIPGIK
jgi:hypothetical protein